MTATASRLDLPDPLTALQIEVAEPSEPPDVAAAAHLGRTVDGVHVEIWTGRPGAVELGDTWRRLGWLQGRVSARRPIAFDVTDGVEWLITEPLPGRRAIDVEYRVDAVRTIGLVGAALAELHALPADRCPFVVSTTELSRRATDALRELGPDGRVNDPAMAHVPAPRLAAIIDEGLERFGPTTDPVVCHGRPTIDQFLLDDGEPVGFDGWQHCGVGDRYHDLAVVARSVAQVLTPHLVPVLFDGYGLERPELARLDWFQLLDTVTSHTVPT